MAGELLHGNLLIWVDRAVKLQNINGFYRTSTDMFGKKLPESIINKIEGNQYVTVSVCNVRVGNTRMVPYTECPVWNEHLNIPVAHYDTQVSFHIRNSQVLESKHTAEAIKVKTLITKGKLERKLRISYQHSSVTGAELWISIEYIPAYKEQPNYAVLPGALFPLRKGGKVTLYQDAHVPDEFLSAVKLDGEEGVQYQHGKCWSDIFDAVTEARNLIYITGWSLDHKVNLVRAADGVGNTYRKTLGELLKDKSKEGVKVLVLLLSDPTSKSTWVHHTEGVMQIHDEETRRYFKNTSVQVLLTKGPIKQEVGTIYAHRQKSVIVDADAGDEKRRIVAFIGGLDLRDGRYDNPQHSIFKTLLSLHKDDYHNPSFKEPVVGCPREAWHDLHCKINGPAAYDVLTNFEDRWRKASKSSKDAFLALNRKEGIVEMFDSPDHDDNDPEAWHARVLRSIDSHSTKSLEVDFTGNTVKNLVTIENVQIDMSLHTAYVNAIRAAQHFIYIENQYFHGSSYNWTDYQDLGANNLIPMEIALKIASKIRAKERFAAYIVIPLWLEGIPTSMATQSTLFWQHKTMRMMYNEIYKALKEEDLEKEFVPQDYLNFFCLGNREAADANDQVPDGKSSVPLSSQELAKKNRRFMIYVHSSGMIVDDEYIILGTANINQRSMEGTMDTEIAIGAYQPKYTWGSKLSSPRGQIYGYRKSLWAEHIGDVEEDCFERPESLECVRKVRSLAESNWRQFAADDITEMKGHLMQYPVEVDQTGTVNSLRGHECFPDLGGNVTGNFSSLQT